MWAIYKLQAKAYFSNIFARVDFITAVLFLIVIGSISVAKGTQVAIASRENIAIVSSISGLMIFNSALWTFGLPFFEMKKSVLLKRIGATKINKPTAIGAFLLWGMTTTLFILIWISMWVGFFQIPAIADGTNNLLFISSSIWAKVNWGGLFVGIIITTLSFYSIAFLFVSFNKNSEIYNITGTFYYFIVAFLGGAVVPTINRDWMTVIGYMSPLGWTSKFMGDAMLGQHVFDLSGYQTLLPGSDQFKNIGEFKAIGRILFPIVFGTLALGASAKIFKWD